MTPLRFLRFGSRFRLAGHARHNGFPAHLTEYQHLSNLPTQSVGHYIVF
jgi:hypothetical protein